MLAGAGDSMFVFWLQLLAILGAAHGLGALARRLRQPPVVGALAAGVLLGPAGLGLLWPDGQQRLFPSDPTQWAFLQGVSWIAVMLLVVVTGFETDLALMRRLGRAALLVATGSLVVPFAAGIALGSVLPAGLIGEGSSRSLFSLFLAAALAISALPVIAKILGELDLMRRNVGQITVAAAAFGDVTGWLLLGAVASAARSGSFEAGALALRFVAVLALLVLCLTAGQRGVDALFRAARRAGADVAALVALTLGLAVLGGIVTYALGIEPIFGGFVAGILCGRSKYQAGDTFGRLETLTLVFFAPVFFATAGLRTDLRLLSDPATLGWALAVLAAASLSKFAGAFAGARAAGLHVREGVALGAALNARGAVELVIATVGLSLGVLNQTSYTIVVLVALATSLMAPPLLRLAMASWPGSPEEQERLARERVHRESLLVRPSRLLLPTHGGPNSLLAARILDLAWPEGTQVTVLSAGASVPPEDLARVLEVFRSKPVEHLHARSDDAAAAVLEQTALGYGALVVGATDRRVEGRLVSSFVDAVLAGSPVPVIMIRGGSKTAAEDVPRIRRILVPAIGTDPGRAAQEVAFGIAQRVEAQVLLAHVVTTPAPADEFAYSRRFWTRAEEGAGAVAARVVEEARALADELGVATETAIRIGVSVSGEIRSLAREAGIDLVVLPASVRQLSERPFLGYGVEHLLEHGESTLVVVSVPPGWRS
jgi:Kef-type K+ transport system membrane component KefB